MYPILVQSFELFDLSQNDKKCSIFFFPLRNDRLSIFFCLLSPLKNASVHQVMGRGRGHGRTKKKARLVEKVVHVKPKKDLAKLGKKKKKKRRASSAVAPALKSFTW